MADKRKSAAKKAARAAERAARKSPKTFLAVVAVILVIAIVAGLLWYFFVYRKGPSDGENGTPHAPDGGSDAPSDVVSGELEIHFLELGNKYAGDCTLIKTGDVEVLIDAGSRQGSAAAIVPYLKTYCTDGVLEYVVATHAHQDHIAAFVGTKAAPGVFDSFDCGVIIDFDLTNTTSNIYRSYVEKRDAEVAAGAEHYTALDCVRGRDGAQKSYSLVEGISFEILYQRFYEEHSSDENNYSVCLLLTQGSTRFLFTGDLEREGEESLVASNSLPHCKLFKGGHHGSPTSSNDCLLEKITPEIVCVCCCAGAPEYTSANDNTFPSQAFVDRVARYTKEIYVTTLATDIDLAGKSWNYASMNGNIVVRSGENFSVHGSNNDVLLKDTEWFKRNRTWPSYGVT